MSLFFADLVREASWGTGTADLPLEGALPGHRRFADAVPPGARFHYCIAGVTRPDEWETGEGEIGSGGTLIRLPLASSAGGATVGFSPGLKTVALTVAAAWFAAREGGVAEIGDIAGLQEALDSKQPRDEELTAIAGVASDGDALPYFNGPGTAGLATFTAFGRSLVDDTDALTGRATLGLGTAATRNTGASGTTIPLLDNATSIFSGRLGVGNANFNDPIAGTSRAKFQDGSMVLSFKDGVAADQGWLALSNGAITGFMATIAAQGFTFGSSSNHGVTLRTNSAGRVHVYAGGNVLIDGFGTGAPPADSGEKLKVNGIVNAVTSYRVNGTQVLNTRRTGWGAPTGTATRTTFATSTVTTAELAERVKALIDDLTTHGLIGA